mmetsp:Transcript_60086/g.170839  ORF Transcript_60086/g.170839 Transcript_60086/m.170839 type:complete len:433 (-) Transcript_60086:55-1353(-)
MVFGPCPCDLHRRDTGPALRQAAALPRHHLKSLLGNTAELWLRELPVHCLERTPLGLLQEAAHLPRAALNHGLGLLRVPDHNSRPVGLLLQEHVAEQGCCGCQMRGSIVEHLHVQKCQLQHVLHQVAVHFAAAHDAHVPLKEVRHCGVTHDELEHCQHCDLHVQYVISCVGVASHVDEDTNSWRMDLLKLCSYEHGGDAHQLEPLSRDLPLCQEPVYQANREKKRLGLQLVNPVHLHEPVDQNSSHSCVDVRLRFHVVRCRQAGGLLAHQIVVDVRRVLCNRLRIVAIALVLRADGLQHRSCWRRAGRARCTALGLGGMPRPAAFHWRRGRSTGPRPCRRCTSPMPLRVACATGRRRLQWSHGRLVGSKASVSDVAERGRHARTPQRLHRPCVTRSKAVAWCTSSHPLSQHAIFATNSPHAARLHKRSGHQP